MGKSKYLIALEEELEQNEGQIDYLEYRQIELEDEITKLKRKIYDKSKRTYKKMAGNRTKT